MDKALFKFLGMIILGLVTLIPNVFAQLPPLIPSQIIFGNPDKYGIEISPDSQWYSYLASSDKGVLNIYLQDSQFKNKPFMISNDQKRGIHSYVWAKDSKRVLYSQDNAGDENMHIYAVDINNKSTRDLTPYPGVKAQGLMLNKDFPNEILVGLNLEDRKLFNVYRINLNTGKVTLDTKNPGDVVGWLDDANFSIRAAVATNDKDGSSSLRVRDNPKAPWKTFITWPFGESGGPLVFSKDGSSIIIQSNRHNNTSRLEILDSHTGNPIKLLASSSRSDVGDVLINENNYNVEAVLFEYLKPEWEVLDPKVKSDFAVLQKFGNGIFNIESRDQKDKTWIVSYYADTKPLNYYVFNRDTKQLKFLFAARSKLLKYQLAPMKPMVIRARDGMQLVSYLTIPAGVKPRNLPLVLDVHGGPWARDSWGYNNEVQWLANRGYAVLQMNFRGSDGFGKNFLNAGNGQWGTGAMQNDLSDGVAWAIRSGIADPKKICIYGGSYGGYATLAGLTFTPTIYACGVDIVGPSNLQTLFATIPPYWKTGIKEMELRIGDVQHNDELNRKISPLFHAENIRAPLLIAQGQNDPRVNVQQSNSIVKTLWDKHIPVSYIIYTDEGHGFARPENKLDFYQRAEAFLAKVLGGRMEVSKPIAGTSAKVVLQNPQS